MTEPSLELVIDRKEAIADGVVRLRLRHPDGDPLPRWEPGAHVDLVLGDGLVRQYSLCGSPFGDSTFEIAVLREEAGQGGSAYVHDVLAEGERVRVAGPRNRFPLVLAERYLFIAGGIGITPLLPMIEAVATRGVPWRLVYGGRTRGSMAFRERLAGAYPDRVDIRPQDESGLLDLPGLLTGPTAVSAGTAVYSCGPESLLRAVEECFAQRPGETPHLERFAPKEQSVAPPRGSFEVELASSGQVFAVPEDRSIVEALTAAGIDVETSCEEGVCGTCETRVLAGEVEHRDSVLTDAERAEGKTMMICVSRAACPRLILDL